MDCWESMWACIGSAAGSRSFGSFFPDSKDPIAHRALPKYNFERSIQIFRNYTSPVWATVCARVPAIEISGPTKNSRQFRCRNDHIAILNGRFAFWGNSDSLPVGLAAGIYGMPITQSEYPKICAAHGEMR
jgi:hypothetical protein